MSYSIDVYTQLSGFAGLQLISDISHIATRKEILVVYKNTARATE
jgi:hypothetical protein